MLKDQCTRKQMVKISKKQRVTLKEIDKLESDRKRDQILGIASIALMAIIIFAYNTLTYQMGIVDEGNVFLRGMMYLTAMVIAGFSGIKLMRASQKKRKIDGFRQSVGISRETLEAWKRGDIE